MATEIFDNMQMHVIAYDYGLYPATHRYENRITDTEGKNFCSIATGDRSTGILIKYDADELEYPA